MAGCHDMRKGQVYVCEGCGVELEVVKECCSEEAKEGCKCHVEGGECEMMCCERPLKLKTD
jgi:hypothetical protein